MNVLWLSHVIPYPPKAGFLLRSYNLLRELARREPVDLIAFVQEPWIRTVFPSLEEGLEESRRALEAFCRSVTFLPIERLGHQWGKPLTGIKALLTGSTYTTSWLVGDAARTAIATALGATHYDIVHFDTIGLVPYRNLAGNLPTTLTHHNVESHLMLRRADSAGNLFARQYFRHEGLKLRQIERATAASFDAHITCSDLDARRFRDIAPGANLIVVPNGVDCDYFASQSRAIHPNSVVFVGTMNWHPNVQAMQYFLRDIWPAVKSRVPSATMDIAGSNPPDTIVKLADSLPDVKIHGYVDDVRPLIDSAAVFACPIRDGGGTKLKILDAFAMGKCVVAHPIACEGIDAVDGREIVLAAQAEDFAAAISALLNDDARRAAIGRAARCLAEDRYSYHAIGAHFHDAMRELAIEHARSH